MVKRRAIPAEMKARVALAARRGDRTINPVCVRTRTGRQIAADFEVHPTQGSQWKRRLEEQVKDLFRDRRSRQTADAERLIQQLCRQIGRLQFESDGLKKGRS